MGSGRSGQGRAGRRASGASVQNPQAATQAGFRLANQDAAIIRTIHEGTFARQFRAGTREQREAVRARRRDVFGSERGARDVLRLTNRRERQRLLRAITPSERRSLRANLRRIGEEG